MSESLCRDLGVTLPEAQPETTRLPHARRAALASTLVAVESTLVDALVDKGVRVHTIGSDRITGGFYYFAKGGTGAAVRVQGNLVEMVAPALATSADNAALEACLDDVIARMLTELSDGMLSEAQIELAAALPALGEAGSEADAKLQTLEGFLIMAGARATKYEDRARAVVEALGQATRRGEGEGGCPALRGCAPRSAAGAGDRVRRRGIGGEAQADASGAEPVVRGRRHAGDDAAACSGRHGSDAESCCGPGGCRKSGGRKGGYRKGSCGKNGCRKGGCGESCGRKSCRREGGCQRGCGRKGGCGKGGRRKGGGRKGKVGRGLPLKKQQPRRRLQRRRLRRKQMPNRLAAARAAAEKARVSEKAEKDKAAAAAGSRTKQAVTVRTRPDAQKSNPREKDARGTPVWVWLVLAFAAALGAYYFAVMRHHG